MSKGNRRADGTVRPSVRRQRTRRRREQLQAMTPEERAVYDARQAERRAWLENFEPGARDRFFKLATVREAMWLRGFARTLGLPQEEAWPELERLANERGWMKLRTKDGMVVGIAPPRNRPERAQAA